MSETHVFHDVRNGEVAEINGGSEGFARQTAADQLGCAKSDLREGYPSETVEVPKEEA